MGVHADIMHGHMDESTGFCSNIVGVTVMACTMPGRTGGRSSGTKTITPPGPSAMGISKED